MFMLVLTLIVGGIFFVLQRRLLAPAVKLCAFAVLVIIVASNPVGAVFLTSCLLLVVGGCIVSSLVHTGRYCKRLPTACNEWMGSRTASRTVLRVLGFSVWFLLKGVGLVCCFVFNAILAIVRFVVGK